MDTATSRAESPLVRSYAPVFIHGLWKRCGTNFLADLLRKHASFEIAAPLWEDALLRRVDLLTQFADEQIRVWQWWLSEAHEDEETTRADLLNHLGEGLISFMKSRITPGKRLLCKTPSTSNLRHFFSLFPQATLLILVRDGRDVVESARRSWPKNSLSYYARQWSNGARQALDFVHGPGQQHPDQWRLLKYEELVQGGNAVINLARFLDLNDGTVDWATCEVTTVRGSSTLRGEQHDLTWKPIQKPSDFDSIGRWKSWTRREHWRFNRVAGRELRELGYDSL